MKQSRLRPPSPLSLLIAELANRATARGMEFFSQRISTHSNQDEPLSRAAVIAGIVRSQGCHCGGTCPHCRHIINDVLSS